MQRVVWLCGEYTPNTNLKSRVFYQLKQYHYQDYQNTGCCRGSNSIPVTGSHIIVESSLRWIHTGRKHIFWVREYFAFFELFFLLFQTFALLRLGVWVPVLRTLSQVGLNPDPTDKQKIGIRTMFFCVKKSFLRLQIICCVRVPKLRVWWC